jgi:hypothetical protein
MMERIVDNESPAESEWPPPDAALLDQGCMHDGLNLRQAHGTKKIKEKQAVS